LNQKRLEISDFVKHLKELANTEEKSHGLMTKIFDTISSHSKRISRPYERSKETGRILPSTEQLDRVVLDLSFDSETNSAMILPELKSS
jgi:hypothetical protein